MMKKCTPIALLALFLGANGLYAQDINPSAGLQWSYKEKLARFQERVQQYEDIAEFPVTTLSGTESAISDEAANEAEIHAAINPTDPDNIVVSPIGENGTVGPLRCPIYYTKNGGTTWARSSYKNMPTGGSGVSFGGGDPVFAYDNDGRLYLVWVEQNGASSSATTVDWGAYWAYSDDGGANWTEPTSMTLQEGQMNLQSGDLPSPVADKIWIATDKSTGQYEGNLYATWVSMSGSLATGTDEDIMFKTKTKGSDTFGSAITIAGSSSFQFVQFPNVAVDGAGTVHVSFVGMKSNQLSIWHTKSTDGGATFSTPAKVSDFRLKMKAVYNSGFDKIPGMNDDRLYPCNYMDVDQSTNNIYMTWTAFGIDTKGTDGSDIYFCSSTDGGSNWSTPKVINDDTKGKVRENFYSSIYVDPATGRIALGWYDRRDNGNSTGQDTHYYVTESTDGGQTFSANQKVTSVASDFTKVALDNYGFGVGEYNAMLISGDYIIPVWCDGRDNDGDLDVYIAFISSQAASVDRMTKITEAFSLEEVYPNPATDKASLRFSLSGKSTMTVELLDVTGKKVKEISAQEYSGGDHEINLNISDLPQGTYFMSVYGDAGKATQKLLVE